MFIKDIFEHDINRQINGVIKVTQDDNENIAQELEEYVITKELRKHFSLFLDNYESAIDTPTDKIGVWISGFFGSGKSHFLKILSYLLSNKEVSGKKAVDYFRDKFDDPMLFQQLERCVSIPTDTILFNIDVVGPTNKDATVILKVFARMFYEHIGLYGRDLKVAKLEQYIRKLGKMDEFKTKFEEVHGDTWEESRESFAFFEDDVTQVLTDVLGMSETAASNWFNGTETAELSIDQLVEEIAEYCQSRGKNYRLLFMVDEIGQYIGSDSSLMLNLQSIVEELGSKCRGQVWVAVTSQEAIDEITKISGDDFSKIQGRFNTRLSLTSASVDEVIKERILRKTGVSDSMLRMEYGMKSAILKNLYTFDKDVVMDLKGYSGEEEFVSSYPFVPYQFRLIQNILAQIRKHGNSGKHISGGERSMLSAFQEAAQVIQTKDETELIPFSLFYNTVHTFLESTIRRVIDRCDEAAYNHDGIEKYDVDVLKLLYLIRYIDDIKPNIDNIATLMVSNIEASKLDMKKAISESLDRLVSQNYVTRDGDRYYFMTDDEQEVAGDIAKTQVNSSDVVKSIYESIFSNLYMSKRFKYDKYDFDFDQLVDDTGTQTSNMKLQIITVNSDLYDKGDAQLILESSRDNKAILLLSNAYRYYQEFEGSCKIRKYAKSRNIQQLPESVQKIIHAQQQRASEMDKRARELLSKAIVEGTVYVQGQRLDISGSSVKDKIDGALRYLVDSVYSKLTYIRKNYNDESELVALLTNPVQNKMEGYVDPNQDAIDEVYQYLSMKASNHLSVTMGEVQKKYQAIPFGWKDIDIAAIICQLIKEQKVQVKYGGAVIPTMNKSLIDYLRKRTEIDKTMVEPRVIPPIETINKVRTVLKDYFNTSDVPTDEDGLVGFIADRFLKEKKSIEDILSQYTKPQYPQKNIVEEGLELVESILAQHSDNLVLFKTIISKKDDLLDFRDDFESIDSFFRNQKKVFDDALNLANSMEKESVYVDDNPEISSSVANIRAVVALPTPYKRISELPNNIQSIHTAYQSILDAKRKDLDVYLASAYGDVNGLDEAEDQIELVGQARDAIYAKEDDIKRASTCTQLDALKAQIDSVKNIYIQKILSNASKTKLKPVSNDGSQPEIRIKQVHRNIVAKAKLISSQEDIDAYVADIKQQLEKYLNDNDQVQIL